MKRYRIKRKVKSVEADSSEEASRIANKGLLQSVHISTMPITDLRKMLVNQGHDPSGMSDTDVKIQCILRYGSWYLVGL